MRHVIGSESRTGFFSRLSAKQNNMRVFSDFFFHFRDPKAPFISQTGAVP